jgi:hypothetical protein
MPEAVKKLVCTQCAKSYVWKPEYAGRTLKCKCGASIKAPAVASSVAAPAAKAGAAPPARPPAAVASAPPPDDDIEKMLGEATEYDVKDEPLTATRPVSRVAAVTMMPAGGAAAVAAPASPLLGYASSIRKPVDEATEASKITDIYIPVALIAVGLLAYIWDAHLWGISNPVSIALFIAIKSVINLVLVFTALLIAVKLIDLGLGPMGPALLKIAAVAVLPGAAGDIITIYTLGLVAWGITILMYWGLLYYLFDMEASEFMITTGILWVVQTWVSTLLIILILSGLGISRASLSTNPPSAARGSLFGPPSTPTNPAEQFDDTPEGQDKYAEYMIQNSDAVEAREWLKPEHTNHAAIKFSIDTQREWTDKFYAAGAKKVWTADFYKLGVQEAAHRLLVEMPDDKKSRGAIMQLVAEMERHPKDPDPDPGSKYLHIYLSND